MNTSDLQIGMRFSDQEGCEYEIVSVQSDRIGIKWGDCKCTCHPKIEQVHKWQLASLGCSAYEEVWRVWTIGRNPDTLLNPEQFQGTKPRGAHDSGARLGCALCGGAAGRWPYPRCFSCNPEVSADGIRKGHFQRMRESEEQARDYEDRHGTGGRGGLG